MSTLRQFEVWLQRPLQIRLAEELALGELAKQEHHDDANLVRRLQKSNGSPRRLSDRL